MLSRNQLFGNGSGTISPVDRWTLELPLAENPWFTSVSSSDVAEFSSLGGTLLQVADVTWLSTEPGLQRTSGAPDASVLTNADVFFRVI